MRKKEWWENFFVEETGEIMFGEIPPERNIKQVDFIVDVLALNKGDEILDLACGQGRHLLELVRRGYKVCGFDFSKTYLAKIKQIIKRENLEAELHRGDMRRIFFRERFDAAINLFTSFGYFEKEEEHQNVLLGVYRALKLKGKFLLDTINRDWLIKNYQPKSWTQYKNFLLLEERNLDFKKSRIEAKWIYISGKKRKVFSLSVRIFGLHELYSLFEKAGFKVIATYGSYNKNDWSPDQMRTIIVGEKI